MSLKNKIGARIPYRIETPRMVMRCWEPSDAPKLRASLDRSDAHLRPFILFMKHEPRTPEETVRRVRANRADFDTDRVYRFALFRRDDDALVGEALLFDRDGSGLYEVGYWIDVDHVRCGYASEAVDVLIAVSFAWLELPRLELVCTSKNTASAALAQKLGFGLEATLRGVLPGVDGGMETGMFWTMFRDDPATPTLPWSRRSFVAFDACGVVCFRR